MLLISDIHLADIAVKLDLQPQFKWTRLLIYYWLSVFNLPLKIILQEGFKFVFKIYVEVASSFDLDFANSCSHKMI
jgi:hypothetical protein